MCDANRGPGRTASRMDVPGVAVQHGPRRILLKWHMLRRAPDDPAHTRANLRTGLDRGAALEVDLQFSADGAGVCLHDETLDLETTGRGPVAALLARDIPALRQRDRHGGILPDPPLLLEEVVHAARSQPPASRGAIQLDVKAMAVDARARSQFAALVAPAATSFTVSGEDFGLVERLAAAAPGVRLGFEPLRLFRDHPPREAEGFRRLAARMLAEAPRAEIVYLHAGLALAALACGENLVGRLVEAGRAVDCWTIDPHRSAVADTLRRLAEAGCGQITTNGPEAIASLFRA